MKKLEVDALEPSNTVLLLVDFINPLRFAGAKEIAASSVAAAKRTAALRRRMSAAGARTIYANDNYGMWTSDFKALWKRCAELEGPPGQMAKVIAPRAKDFSLLKPRHSAFYATPLDILLTQLHCKKLVITGLAADSCVLFSAMDAYLRGYSTAPPDQRGREVLRQRQSPSCTCHPVRHSLSTPSSPETNHEFHRAAAQPSSSAPSGLCGRR